MKIRYLQSMGRPRGPSIAKGDEADVDNAEAERLIAKGFAEPIDAAPRGRRKQSASPQVDEDGE